MSEPSHRTPRNCEDIIVIGSGAAGLTFALEASKYLRVAILTKDAIEQSNTRWAQGGLAAVLAPADDYHRHIKDTIEAGGGIGNREAITILVHEAPARVRDLQNYGVSFDSRRDHGLSFTREGGHSQNRIVHVGDLTGLAIEEALVNQVRLHPRINVYEHLLVTDLVVKNGTCYGVTYLDANGQSRFMMGRSVIVATGGAGQLYPVSTNPVISTGDGVAMAHRAGARLKDMEFVQFHPTALVHEGAPPLLISEALRGEGAKLITLDDERRRLMDGVHPLGDLAPRDIVARTIYQYLIASQQKAVGLDITHMTLEALEKRFPYITEQCLSYGIDPSRQPIPVAPAAHYFCGGIETTIDGQTNIRGLYACGEAACTGIHGGNRLASNSLLESLVFGYRSAVHAQRYIQQLTREWYLDAEEYIFRSTPQRDRRSEAPAADIASIRARIQATCQEFAGIVRTDEGLQEGRRRIKALGGEIQMLRERYRPSKPLQETYNLVIVAKKVLQHAQDRRENVGAHFNEDLVKVSDTLAKV